MFNFDFENLVIKNEHHKVTKESITGRFIGALCAPFTIILYPVASWLFDQIFLTSASEEGLDRHAGIYSIERALYEGDAVFKQRLFSKKAIINNAACKKGIKSLTYQFFGTIPDLQEEYYMPDGFKTGVSKLGSGKMSSGNYRAFVSKVILPTLSESLKRKMNSYLSILDEINFGGNEIIVLEKVAAKKPFAVGESKLGIESFLYRYNEPLIEFVRYN